MFLSPQTKDKCKRIHERYLKGEMLFSLLGSFEIDRRDYDKWLIEELNNTASVTFQRNAKTLNKTEQRLIEIASLINDPNTHKSHLERLNGIFDLLRDAYVKADANSTYHGIPTELLKPINL